MVITIGPTALPALSWRARAYWADAKGGQSQLAAGVLPHRDIAQDMLFQLYAVLGGSSRPSSPLFIDLCQQGVLVNSGAGRAGEGRTFQ